MLAIAAGAKRNQSKTLANTSGGQGFKPMKAANGTYVGSPHWAANPPTEGTKAAFPPLGIVLSARD